MRWKILCGKSVVSKNGPGMTIITIMKNSHFQRKKKGFKF